MEMLPFRLEASIAAYRLPYDPLHDTESHGPYLPLQQTCSNIVHQITNDECFNPYSFRIHTAIEHIVITERTTAILNVLFENMYKPTY